MSLAFPEIRVGDPIRHEGLAVFPLFADPAHGVAYDLGDEALNKGTVIVEEVSEAGSVPDLSVENKGDIRVLFLEGEEYRAESPIGDHASALVFNGTLVHGSVVCAM